LENTATPGDKCHLRIFIEKSIENYSVRTKYSGFYDARHPEYEQRVEVFYEGQIGNT